MQKPQFFFSAHYNAALEKIEDFVPAQSGSIAQVEQFLEEHDEVLAFVGENPGAAPLHPQTEDQSWPFRMADTASSFGPPKERREPGFF